MTRVKASRRVLEQLERDDDLEASEAASGVLAFMLERTGGRGGIIVVKKDQIGFCFTTCKMAWAAKASGWGEVKSGI